MRALATAGVLLSLAVTAQAQSPAWDAFHEALDSFEYEKAAGLAEKVAEGSQRNLARAELAVLSGLVHRSYPFTDRISISEVPVESLAVYYLVKIHQESKTPRPTSVEKRQVIMRLLKEGLRQEGSARNLARLLMYQIQHASGDLDTTRQIVEKLAELPNVEPRLVVEAQAILASRERKFEQAASLWAVLAQSSTLRGDATAALIYRARSLRQHLEQTGDLAPEALVLTKAALDSGDAVAMREVWAELRHKLPRDEAATMTRVVLAGLPRLPDGGDKLILMDRMVALGIEPMRTEVSRMAYEQAHRLGDKVLEAEFLDELIFSLRGHPEAAELARTLESLSRELDIRAQPYLSSQSSWRRERDQEKARTVWSLATLEEDLIHADGPADRVKLVLTSHLRQALEAGDARLSEHAFLQAFEETLQLDPPDRGSALNFLLNAYLTVWPYHGANFDNSQGTIRDALRQALGEKLKRRPDLVRGLLDSELSFSKGQPNLSLLGAKMLAGWLSAMSRFDEARDVIENSREGLFEERALEELLADLGGIRLQEGLSDGYALIEKAYASAAGSSTWHYSLIGWEAARTHRWSEAERWARLATDIPSAEVDAETIKRNLYQLRAIALARLGRPQEGLQILEQGRLLAENLQPPIALRGYDVVLADLQLESGQVVQAVAALEASPMDEVPRTPLYELDVRRRVAAASGDPSQTKAIEDKVDAFLALPSSLPDDPIVSHFLRKALGRPYANLPPLGPAESFAEVAEGLEQLRRREPKNEALARLSLADLKRLSRACEKDELVLQPVLLEHSVAFVVLGQSTVRLLELYCDRTRLDKALRSFSSSLTAPETQIDDEAQAYLYARLVRPWREQYPTTRRVRWLASDTLARLPISALRDDTGQHVLDGTTAMYLDGPSVSRLRLDAAARALLVGGASDLKGASDELRQVRKLFPEGETWNLGDDLAVLRREISDANLVHVSTHGVVPSGNVLSGALQGDGHSLTAFQLTELVLPPSSLVVVAACESVVDAGTGKDNTSLVGAFRAAGAELVLGSAWPIDDQVTAVVITEFYRQMLAGKQPDEALRAAQIKTARNWPHPFYWAGFQLVTGP